MRLPVEKRTIQAMLRIYCRKNHGDVFCNDCNELLIYAFKRIEHCPYGLEKPACKDCTIHCYSKEKRERIKEVMRFSGRRMPLRHPYLTLMHFLKERK